MRIAAAVDEAKRVLPLPDGPTVMILDTDTRQAEEYPNPGHALKEGRRAATTDFLHEKGVSLVLAVPQTFCAISHEKARSYQMRFALLEPGTTWADVVNRQLWTDTVAEIPAEQLFKPQKG